MKLKKGITPETLKKYGFAKIVQKDDLPYSKWMHSDIDINNVEDIADVIENLIKEDEKTKRECYVVEKYSAHYYDKGYILILDYSRRGQHYYLLVDLELKSMEIGATQPDGSGDSIPLNPIIFEMYNDGIFETI